MNEFKTYFLDVLKNKYAQFDGRARRAEYWYFTLFNGLIGLVIGIIDRLLTGGVLGIIWMLAVLVPGIALAVRRLHDVGRSGWFYLIGLIPIVGAIWLIILFCTPGVRGDNEYGPDPKAGEVM